MFKLHKLYIALFCPSIAPAVVAAGLSAAGSVLGGIFGSSGAKNANKNARELQNQNLTWQENMSNSAYQRAMMDMEKAGLNPMLAYQQGGASSPNAPAAPPVLNEKSDLARGVSGAAQAAAQIYQIQSTTAKMNGPDTAKTLADADLASAQAAQTRLNTAENMPAQAELTKAQTHQVGYQTANILAQTSLTNNQTRKVTSEIQQIARQGELTLANVKESLSRAALTTAQINEVAPRIMNMMANTTKTNSETGWADTKGILGNSARALIGAQANETVPAAVLRKTKKAWNDTQSKFKGK